MVQRDNSKCQRGNPSPNEKAKYGEVIYLEFRDYFQGEADALCKKAGLDNEIER